MKYPPPRYSCVSGFMLAQFLHGTVSGLSGPPQQPSRASETCSETAGNVARRLRCQPGLNAAHMLACVLCLLASRISLWNISLITVTHLICQRSHCCGRSARHMHMVLTCLWFKGPISVSRKALRALLEILGYSGRRIRVRSYSEFFLSYFFLCRYRLVVILPALKSV